MNWPVMREDISDPTKVTPVVGHASGDYFAKRDDWFICNGARGGKVRAAYKLCQDSGGAGVVTYGSRTSPQGAYTAAAARKVGVPCSYVTAHGAWTKEMQLTDNQGADVVQVKPGYLSQCCAEARRLASTTNREHVLLSMESKVAVNSTRGQVRNLPFDDIKRIVIVVGGGVSMCGVLWGLRDCGHGDMPVLGVKIGKDPIKIISKWAPDDWQRTVTLAEPTAAYHEMMPNVWEDIVVDPYYEAKCLPYIEPGDLFWIVGVRPGLCSSDG